MDKEACPRFRLEEETIRDRPEFQFGPPEAFGTITGGIAQNVLDATLKILEVSQAILPENKVGNGLYHPRPVRNDRVLILDVLPHCDRKGKGEANENGAGQRQPCERCSRFPLVLCEKVYARPEMRTAYTHNAVLQAGPGGTYTLDAVEDLDRLILGERDLLVSTVTMIGVEGMLFEEHQLWAMNMMRQVLRLAAMHKHELLVLGSVACEELGARQAQNMASCWSQVLQETEFAGGWWRAIWFAVNDNLKDGRVAAFKKELQHKVFGIVRPSNRLEKPRYPADADLRRSLSAQPQRLPQPQAISRPKALPEPKALPQPKEMPPPEALPQPQQTPQPGAMLQPEEWSQPREILQPGAMLQPEEWPQPREIPRPREIPQPKAMPKAEISIRVKLPEPELSTPKSIKEYIMESKRPQKDLPKSKNTSSTQPPQPAIPHSLARRLEATTRPPQVSRDSQTETGPVDAIPKQNGENGTNGTNGENGR